MKYYKLAQSIAHFALIGIGFYFLFSEASYAFICYCIIGALQVVDTTVNYLHLGQYPWMANRKWHKNYLLVVMVLLLVGVVFQVAFVLLAYFLLFTSPVVALIVLCSIAAETTEGFNDLSDAASSLDPEILETEHFS